MAQYEASTSSLATAIQNSGVSAGVGSAITDILEDLGTTTQVLHFEGQPLPLGTGGIVIVPTGEPLTVDPGGQVIIFSGGTGTGGNVVLGTGAGGRVVVGGSGAEFITFSGAGGATVETGGGNDSVVGGAGADFVTITGSGNATVVSGLGNDRIIVTGGGNSSIFTGAGNDVIEFGTDQGSATVVCGTGFDQGFLNDSRDNHLFGVVNGILQMNSAPTTLEDVEVIVFNDGISVIADNHDKAIVAKMYEIVFSREADLPGLEYWMGRVDSGDSLEHIVHSFTDCNEFRAMFEGKTNTEFLQSMYQNLAGREADESGLNYWLGRMANGTTYAQVAWSFAESHEAIEVMGIDGTKYVIEIG